jgi:hypothetical protein
MEQMRDEQNDVCREVGVAPDPPKALHQKLGIALDSLHLEPLNSLRHPDASDPEINGEARPVNPSSLTRGCARRRLDQRADWKRQ